MSLSRRLFNIARAELIDAARRLRGGSREGLRADPTGEDVDPLRRDDRPSPRRAHPMEPPPEIRRYYANLELPVGAPAAEVKAAYRRLMRRYHPDRHYGSPERAEAADRLAKELRTAYEGLLAYLGERS